tara:strand:+ start:1575 stop:2153 length:579 start_codon:yes stop_codon:yes gene_type:complete
MKLKERIFLDNYYKKLKDLLNLNESKIDLLISVKQKILQAKKRNKKIIICGNGGSASIASHFSVDLSKNAKIKCINFNEANLLTCLSNDYGYEKWIEKALKIYGEQGDCLILISSSGKSQNMLNAAKFAKKKKFSSIITFTGFHGKGYLSKLGNINLVVDSRSYNFVENVHQVWLLSIVDLLIGSTEYRVDQ